MYDFEPYIPCGKLPLQHVKVKGQSGSEISCIYKFSLNSRGFIFVMSESIGSNLPNHLTPPSVSTLSQNA